MVSETFSLDIKTSDAEESVTTHNEVLQFLIYFAIKILYLISNSNFSSFSLTSLDLTAGSVVTTVKNVLSPKRWGCPYYLW